MKKWINGQFYTMRKPDEAVKTVVTDKGLIIATGEAAKVMQVTEIIDLKGKTVFPGFVDSHLHLLWYGQALDRLNLQKTTTKKEALMLIKKQVANVMSGQWLFIEGYDENKWQDTNLPLTKTDLDLISRDIPILVRRVDYHSVSINQALLDEININAGYVGGGEIVVDSEGAFTGILRDNAIELAIKAFPEPSQADLEKWMKIAVCNLWQKGLTGAHSEDLHYFNGFNETLAAFRSILHGDRYPFRTHLLIHHAELTAFLKSTETFMSGDPFVELGAMKIFFDGTVGSRTALMRSGYANDEHNHGLAIHSDAEFAELVQSARQAKLPVAVHVLGDLAFQKVIKVLELYPPLSGQYDRLIHTPWLRPDLIEAAKKLPVLFDVQPQFMASDLPWVFDVLSENKPPLAFPWRTMQEAGLRMAFGSDAPIEVPNPFWGIHAAVTRTVNQDLNGKAYFPAERLTVYEAITYYTCGSAFASYKTNTRGVIAPGFVADFTITKENPFTVAAHKLRDIQVAMTVVNEKIVFQD